jgi:Fe-S-cluster-containing hydrogenase component 2
MGKRSENIGKVKRGRSRRIRRISSESSFCNGPKAVIECFEEIPCDPCVDACPKGAIRIEGSITALPVLDFEKCTGCGLCIPACPGLAVFVVDSDWSENEGRVKLPYEFLPLPEEKETVIVLDQNGKEIGTGRVHSILNPLGFDHTAVISLIGPKEIVAKVRHFKPVK